MKERFKQLSLEETQARSYKDAGYRLLGWDVNGLPEGVTPKEAVQSYEHHVFILRGVTEGPLLRYYMQLLQERIDQALSSLTIRERFVVTMRYGLGGSKPVEIDEIAREVQRSRSTVYRDLSRGLAKAGSNYLPVDIPEP